MSEPPKWADVERYARAQIEAARDGLEADGTGPEGVHRQRGRIEALRDILKLAEAEPQRERLQRDRGYGLSGGPSGY